MSQNTLKLTAEQFLSKLENELKFVEDILGEKMDQESKEELLYYQQIHKKIVSEVQDKSVKKVTEVYGQFLRSVKQFKRRVDNSIKFNERDIDSFRKRYERTAKHLIPLIHDIKMNVLERMTKFDINQLKNHNFQMHLYTNKELCEITLKIFDFQGIYKTHTNYTSAQIKSLLTTLCLKYNVIPYHNWTHAFSVFQMMFCLYEASPSWREYITPFEFFCSQVSSLGHDINHKGMGNLYKQKRQAQVSLNYCELGVLENMHSSKLFQILQGQQEEDFNYFSALKDQNKVSQFKRILITCILATDMSKHAKVTAKLKKRIAASMKVEALNKRESQQQAGQNEEEINREITDLDKDLAFKKDCFEDRRFIVNAIVHACDVGNPCLEYNNYMNWSYLISQEFSDQTEKEAQHNLPVTGFLIYKDKLTFLNGQTFFCKAMVLPIWQDIGEFFPELKKYPEAITENLNQLEIKKSKLRQQNPSK